MSDNSIEVIDSYTYIEVAETNTPIVVTAQDTIVFTEPNYLYIVGCDFLIVQVFS